MKKLFDKDDIKKIHIKMINDKIFDKLPSDWKKKPPDKDNIPEGICIIQCDAAFKGGVTGICTIIRKSGKEHIPEESSAITKGPVHAELTAIYRGLQRIQRIGTVKQPIQLCIIYTDSKSAYNLLCDIWKPKVSHIIEIIDKIEDELIKLLDKDIDFHICNIRSKYNRRVDRRALKKRKDVESKKKKKIEERIEKVKRAIQRSKIIKISENNGEYVAISNKNGFSQKYKVSLSPHFCECAGWMNTWGNKERYMINARALPCKHMCALADHLQQDIYQIFHKQINRID